MENLEQSYHVEEKAIVAAAPPPPKTLEDFIREIVREEIEG